jgi:hypothetical protein
MRVNAGGEVFTTLASTLTQCGEGPLLDAVNPYVTMYPDRESLRTAHPLFLDVDPKLFEALLRVLRMRRMAVARKASAKQAAGIRHPPRMDLANVDVEADQWKFLVHHYQLGRFLDDVSSGDVEDQAPKAAWHGRKRAKSGLQTYKLATGGHVLAEGHGDGESGGVIIIHLPDGQTVTTLSSTLQVRDSRLTTMVEQALEAVASAGATGGAGLEVFLDVEPECCRLLVNFLRLRRMGQYHDPPLLPLIPEVPVHLHQDWETMLDYLQLREDVEGIRDVLPGFVLSGNFASRQARLSSGGGKKGNSEVIEISDSDDDDPLSKNTKETPAPAPAPSLLPVKAEATPGAGDAGRRMRRISEADDESDDEMQTAMKAEPEAGPGSDATLVPPSNAPLTRVEKAGAVLSTYTDGVEVGYQGLKVEITEGSVRVPIQPLLTAPGTYYLQLRIDIEDSKAEAENAMDTKSSSSTSSFNRKLTKPKKPNVRLFLQRVRDGRPLGFGFETARLMRTGVSHVLKVDLMRGQMTMRNTSTNRVNWMTTPFLPEHNHGWRTASQTPPDFTNDLFFDPSAGQLEYGAKYQLCLNISAAETRLQDKGVKGHVVKVAFMPVSKKLYYSHWTNRCAAHAYSS